MTKRYRAEIYRYRDGDWYMIRLPDIDGLTRAETVDEIELMARECIAVTLDVPIAEVLVDLVEVES